MIERLLTEPARLAAWNDRVNGGDTRSTYRRPRLHRVIDRVCGRVCYWAWRRGAPS